MHALISKAHRTLVIKNKYDLSIDFLNCNDSAQMSHFKYSVILPSGNRYIVRGDGCNLVIYTRQAFITRIYVTDDVAHSLRWRSEMQNSIFAAILNAAFPYQANKLYQINE
jgi:hypothetical protein